VVLYTELLCYHPYLVSMLFADLLSLHLVTFLMSFILVYIDVMVLCDNYTPGTVLCYGSQ